MKQTYKTKDFYEACALIALGHDHDIDKTNYEWVFIFDSELEKVANAFTNATLMVNAQIYANVIKKKKTEIINEKR